MATMRLLTGAEGPKHEGEISSCAFGPESTFVLSGGWDGYLQRSMLQALGQASHPYSQSYCGGGSLAACQLALQGALQATIDELTSLYGTSNPSGWTCSRSNPSANAAGPGSGQVAGVQCNPTYDDIQYNAVGVGTVPSMPWVNRPTFQQVVQFQAGR